MIHSICAVFRAQIEAVCLIDLSTFLADCAQASGESGLISGKSDEAGPLAGVRVIELGTLIAGPFASRVFADFGADVIKIESRDGDPLRKWRVLHNGTSLWWHLQSRNKRLLSLNLKSEEGVAIVRQLVKSADVVIENFRPGMLERLGLGWDVLSRENPDLVMVRISGFGQSGPYRDRPGFGAIGEALGGIRYTTGTPEAPPSRVGISLGDSLASLHAVIGALMALLRVRSKRGAGQVVDVALSESVFNMMESLVPEYSYSGLRRERTGGKLPGICPSNTYQSADGDWIVIAGNSDAIYRRLMNAIGRPDLASDPKLQSNEGRVTCEEEIDGAIAGWTAGVGTAHAIQVLQDADVPCDRIYSAADIMVDPQFREREAIVDTELPDGTSVAMPGILPKLSETPGRQRWLGGEIGQHTDEILREMGFDVEEVARLKSAGIVA